MSANEIKSGITDHFGRLVEITHPLRVLASLLHPFNQFRVKDCDYSCAFLFDHETAMTIMRVQEGNKITYSLALPLAFVDFDECDTLLACETFYNYVVLKERA